MNNVKVVMKGNKPALLVNIRITLDKGSIQQIESINVCDDLACSGNSCFDTKDSFLNNSITESVILIINDFFL